MRFLCDISILTNRAVRQVLSPHLPRHVPPMRFIFRPKCIWKPALSIHTNRTDRQAVSYTRLWQEIIVRASYQSKKQQEKATLQVFFVLFTRPASPPSTYGTLRLPPMLLTTTIKKKTIRRYSRLFASGLLSRVRVKYPLFLT